MKTATSTKLIYVYGFVPSSEVTEGKLESFVGFDGEHPIYTLEQQGITAIACKLNDEHYSEETLEKKTEDMKWLHEKALHHHETLKKLNKEYTLLPLHFCTVFKSEENVQEKMSSVNKELSKLFKELVGKEEWTLKIYSDEKQLKPYVEENNKDIKTKSEEIKSLSKGRQYFERKKLERLLQEKISEEKKRLSKEIHEELSALTSKSGIKKNWNQKVTGRQDKMSWNSVYLIKEGDVKRFLDEVGNLGEKYKTYGLQLEATGPWPCYYFAKVEGE